MQKETNEIEVIDTVHCTGACEACECNSNDPNQLITFKGSLWAESPSTNAFSALIEFGETSASNLKWFSLKFCSFERYKDDLGIEKIKIKAPKWVLEKQKIINLISKI